MATSAVMELRRQNKQLVQDLEVSHRMNEVYKDQRDRSSTEKTELERRVDDLKAENQRLQHLLQKKDAEIKRLNERIFALSWGEHVAPGLSNRIGPLSSTALQDGEKGEALSDMSFLSIPLPSRIQKQHSQGDDSKGSFLQENASGDANDDMENGFLAYPESETEDEHDSGDNIFTGTLQKASSLNTHVTTIADDDREGWIESDPDHFLLVKLLPEAHAKARVVEFGGYPTNVHVNNGGPLSTMNGASLGSVLANDNAVEQQQDYGNSTPIKRRRSTTPPGQDRGLRGDGGGGRGRQPTTNALAVDQLYTYFVAKVLAVKPDETAAQRNHLYRVQYYRKMVAAIPGGGYNRFGDRLPSEVLYFVQYENETVYEVDEEDVEIKLPPPQYERRGQIKFNFPFLRYRLG